MRKFNHIWLLLLLSLVACEKSTIIPNEKLVDITTVNNRIILDIRYATENNFLHEAVYETARCFVLEAVAVKLDSIQVELEQQGLGLKVFDGYRPLSVQRKMWAILPDDRYVANPNFGSMHNRGAAVDVSLVDSSGNELAMPTDYDDFSEQAYFTFMDLPEQVLKNRDILRTVMEKHDFGIIETEWWHYHLHDYMDHPVLDLSFDEIDKLSKQ
jgi:D-alanyl-D-alanine dipeptidase